MKSAFVWSSETTVMRMVQAEKNLIDVRSRIRKYK